ncbi:Lnb N-terminal periplasmic domain-containing protein [Flavobacterium silvaticum]|uniref:DUF4105 domain-containing protein n=1 Tax=Flavobacterium silvaticum TaxID=1852020 RepID=A0A972FNT1_9FLAO|nr:DUF4105 domain-containing protein [Flavobacterium silvaticum]NMH29469.1 DUF4105 domain-containing protein [Flavobacterium silvaticum]
MRFPFKAFLLFLFTVSAFSQTLSDKARVSLITCGKGDQLYSLFGHTALRINDPVTGIDRVYNYGTFDFRTPNFVLRFVKGDMQYFASASSFNDFIYEYQYDKRSVFEQLLNFPQDKKQVLFDRLNKSLQGPEKFYTYKFLDNNCTTKVMELINDVLGSKVLKKVGNKEVSYRDLMYTGFEGHFFEQWGTSLFFGPKVDRKAENIFLPIELWESVNAAQYRNKPLLEKNISWLVFDDPVMPFSIWNNVFVYLIFLALLVFWRNKTLVLSYFTIVSLLGAFFCFQGLYSFHEELKWDYNALLVNPLLFGLVIAYLRKSDRQLFIWSWINLICLLLYLGCMITKIHLLIMLPMIVAHGIILLTWALQSRKRLKVDR